MFLSASATVVLGFREAMVLLESPLASASATVPLCLREDLVLLDSPSLYLGQLFPGLILARHFPVEMLLMLIEPTVSKISRDAIASDPETKLQALHENSTQQQFGS
nr:hypothetical protein Iba_scaffold60119CG0010 [Ipomoea batatas]GMD44909.1 hypothetical protein Iba_chr10dCG5010 [Ipomoea batatas]GME01324.1 hypothetical protein Iba_scaffold57261CG0010 [Ipomoea batatas]